MQSTESTDNRHVSERSGREELTLSKEGGRRGQSSLLRLARVSGCKKCAKLLAPFDILVLLQVSLKLEGVCFPLVQQHLLGGSLQWSPSTVRLHCVQTKRMLSSAADVGIRKEVCGAPS